MATPQIKWSVSAGWHFDRLIRVKSMFDSEMKIDYLKIRRDSPIGFSLIQKLGSGDFSVDAVSLSKRR